MNSRLPIAAAALAFATLVLSACGGGGGGGVVAATGEEQTQGDAPLPPLPVILKAGGDALPAAPVPLPAMAEAGEAVMIVEAKNGGEFMPPLVDNGFGFEGGDSVAIVSLTSPMTALFSKDNLILSVGLAATNAAGAETVTALFRSSPFGINGAGLSTLFVTAFLSENKTLFTAQEAGLTILHIGRSSGIYKLLGSGADLFDVDSEGAVRAVVDMFAGDDRLLYELTLRLALDGATAERLLTVVLAMPEDGGFDAVIDCKGQWPCRDQFAEALSLRVGIEGVELRHNRLIALESTAQWHADDVSSIARVYGSGASVSVTLAGGGKGASERGTFSVFLELPAKQTLIVNHSVPRFIAHAETMREKDAIVTQSSGNDYLHYPNFYEQSYRRGNDERYAQGVADTREVIQTGLMVVVGGISKVANANYDFDTDLTRCDYPSPISRLATPPTDKIQIDGEDWCSTYNRCGWMKDYCLVAPAISVVFDPEMEERVGRGTSYSAPQVAAALDLLRAMWPELSQVDLARMVLELADDLGEGEVDVPTWTVRPSLLDELNYTREKLEDIDPVYGHGRLSFRRLYMPGGWRTMIGGEMLRFSCDAETRACAKERI